jgi:hypothetical protein
MIRHKIEGICSVNTKSSNFEVSLEQPNAIFIKMLSQQALTVAHMVVNMNSNKC